MMTSYIIATVILTISNILIWGVIIAHYRKEKALKKSNSELSFVIKGKDLVGVMDKRTPLTENGNFVGYGKGQFKG